MTSRLTPLPPQPAGVEWPTMGWPRTDPDAAQKRALEQHADPLFSLTAAQGVTYALLVVKGGKFIYERYDAGASVIYLQYSWSMAKSITHALVGIAVREGLLDPAAPAPVPEWHGRNDPRSAITLDQLLRMSSGLVFNEDYVDGAVSDVIPMLFGPGRHDTGAFAAAMPLANAPGSAWSYASGTTNIVCRILRDAIGGGPTGMLDFMRRELFEPIGMTSPVPKFDTSGTFVGSSYCLANPDDFARFGYLYLRDGVWDGKRILPAGWVDYARSCTYRDATQAYGAHWWLHPEKPWFYASGYDGQRILIVPERDLIIVRCGRTPVTQVQYVWDHVYALAESL